MKRRPKTPEIIVDDYVEEMSSGFRIEGDATTVRAYYAKVNHAAIRWYIEPETNDITYYPELLAQAIDMEKTGSNRNAEKFRKRAGSILHDRRKNWVCVSMSVHAASIVFYYENRKTENEGYITLDLSGFDVGLTMIVEVASNKNIEYEISYDPTDKTLNLGCHVFCQNKETKENWEYDFYRNSDEVSICYRRPEGLPDR